MTRCCDAIPFPGMSLSMPGNTLKSSAVHNSLRQDHEETPRAADFEGKHVENKICFDSNNEKQRILTDLDGFGPCKIRVSQKFPTILLEPRPVDFSPLELGSVSLSSLKYLAHLGENQQRDGRNVAAWAVSTHGYSNPRNMDCN